MAAPGRRPGGQAMLLRPGGEREGEGGLEVEPEAVAGWRGPIRLLVGEGQRALDGPASRPVCGQRGRDEAAAGLERRAGRRRLPHDAVHLADRVAVEVGEPEGPPGDVE